jgi:tRNA (cmo5U34)-methyltransferase
MGRDDIFLHDHPQGDFVFDDKVASVFHDMISRSVPGYATIISMIGVLAERYAQPGTRCYDLGCSLGAATLAMRHHLEDSRCEIIAVDSAHAMVMRCQDAVARDKANTPVQVLQADILDLPMDNASVVVLNFTLQFIAPARRAELIQRIHQAMLPGGMLILSEKVRFEDADLDELFINVHHRFKRSQGYSELEVSRKRAAIENVLIPETPAAHRARIKEAGFSAFGLWFQCFNFASMVAIK